MEKTQAQALIDTGAVQTMNGRPCLNVPLFIPFSVSLAAGATRLDLAQSVPGDADFFWRGTWYDPTNTGNLFLVRFRLATGYYMSNVAMPMDQLNVRAITGEIRIPAGNPIGIEATNGTVGTVLLKIVFWGVKRYYLS